MSADQKHSNDREQEMSSAYRLAPEFAHRASKRGNVISMKLWLGVLYVSRSTVAIFTLSCWKGPPFLALCERKKRTRQRKKGEVRGSQEGEKQHSQGERSPRSQHTVVWRSSLKK